MIRVITSSLPYFKTLTFHDGFNILLADKSPSSTEGQTRNSAGKSSFVELVHFLLGASARPDSLFRNKALVDHTFTGVFQIGERLVEVARTGSEPSRILISPVDAEALRIEGRQTKNSPFYVTNEDWKAALADKMFGLQGGVAQVRHAPSFRTMISYFARRASSAAFDTPERIARAQSRGDYQICISYLLGLDWRLPSELESVRDRERHLRELRKASKDGAFDHIVGTVAELRPKVALSRDRAEQLRSQLSRFVVAESYREMSDEAAAARAEMLELELSGIAMKDSLEHLERALQSEVPQASSGISRLYTAIGIQLPEIALRRFEDVAEFHASVVRNREAYLKQEIATTTVRIREIDRKVQALDNRRAEILSFLRGKGAFEDFLQLQAKLAALESEAETLRRRYDAAELLEGQSTELEIDRANLKRRTQADHEVRNARINEAILDIGRLISTLYDDRSGEFNVGVTDNGPEFSISIEGDRGGGISHIEIFCFDMALQSAIRRQSGGPGFLIHDSHLFDPVDERQISRALALGAKNAVSAGTQYIVALNSDVYDRLSLPEDFDWDKAVMKTRLSDAGETGGLFGFRFD